MNTLQYREMEDLLASDSPAVPLLTRQELQAVSRDEALAFLLPLATREIQTCRKYRSQTKRLAVGFLIWQAVFLFFLYHATTKPGLQPFLVMLFVPGIVILISRLVSLTRLRRRFSIKRTLNSAVAVSEFSDSRTLGPLLDTLAIAPPEVRPLLIPTITEVLCDTARGTLPLVLDTRRRAILRRELRKIAVEPGEMETDFCIASMKALTLCGDRQVESLLRGLSRQTTGSFHRGVVRDAARECLGLLEKEVAQATAARRTLIDLFRGKEEIPATLALQESYLNSLGPERAKTALASLVMEGHSQKWRRFALAGLAQLTLYGILVTIFYFLLKDTNFVFPMVCMGLSMVLSVTSSYWLPETKLYERAATRLCRYADKSLAGTLLDALRQGHLKDALTSPLANVLLQMTPADAALLTAEQREYLRETLASSHTLSTYPTCSSRYRAPFLIAVIHTLAVIRDSEARPLIAKTFREHPLAPVRDAAERVVVANGLQI